MGLGEGYGADVDASLRRAGRWMLRSPGDSAGWHVPSGSSCACTLPCPAWMGGSPEEGLSHLFSQLSPWQSTGRLRPWTHPSSSSQPPSQSDQSPGNWWSGNLNVSPEPCAGQLAQTEAQSLWAECGYTGHLSFSK